MKVALAQINTHVGNFSYNVDSVLMFVNIARTNGAELVVFPELTLTGYPIRDLSDDKTFQDSVGDALAGLIEKLPKDMVVIVGTIISCMSSKVYNSAVLITGNQLTFLQDKTLLPNYDVFDERRNFSGDMAPNIFEYKGKKIGITICEDIWNHEPFIEMKGQTSRYLLDPIRTLKIKGAEVIINLSASPYELGKYELRREMLEYIASENELPIVYVNLVGGNDDLVFDGGSMVVFPDKNVISCNRFREELMVVDLTTKKPLYSVPKDNSMCTEEELFRATVLGLRDYVRKCGFKKVVLGLSGGIDSALVAAIAVEALGSRNVTGIRLPSLYSSDSSLTDAQDLADKLGIKLLTMPIEQLRGSFEQAFVGEPSSTYHSYLTNLLEGSNIARENLQARLRGSLLMCFSNASGALLLTTGNKSEIAVGYCTVYGDTCGALAPIADLWKGQVYAICRWLGNKIPSNILEKEPSAELSPGQKDSDSLPSYDVLDNILRLHIEEMRSIEEIIATTKTTKDTVVRILRMVNKAEYKRQQAAPGIKTSKKAFGRGRRIPIARFI